MKLKKDAIKPDMVILCQNQEESKALLEYLEKFTECRWLDGSLPTCGIIPEGINCYYIDEDWQLDDNSPDYYEEEDYEITKFSDLVIEPDENLTNLANNLANPKAEMSAVEVLEWLKTHGENIEDMHAAFGWNIDCFADMAECGWTPEFILDKINAYEAAKKEPKPVEVEWVDICRIIQIQDNGFKKCVYEEAMPEDNGCINYQNAENILKKYISEHEGQYIAVTEAVCRAKEEQKRC